MEIMQKSFLLECPGENSGRDTRRCILYPPNSLLLLPLHGPVIKVRVFLNDLGLVNNL